VCACVCVRDNVRVGFFCSGSTNSHSTKAENLSLKYPQLIN